MISTNNPAINQFIINQCLIEPVSKILIGLNNREYRDCDIKWLNDKLDEFTNFACETLQIKVIMPIIDDRLNILNDYLINRYIEYFRTLLNYFKTL
jgi:hypothetical protein